MSDRDPEILAKLDLLLAAQQEQAKAIARVEGQMSVALQWLQSMDQRFVALMHPFEPPAGKKKSA